MLVRRRARWIAWAPLILLAACDNGRPTGPALPAPPMALVAYDGCGELLKNLREATERQVGPYGLGGSSRLPLGAMPEDARRADATAPGAAPGQAPGAQEKRAEHSGTNTHEAGVDEPDLVKTDGRRIVALARGRLHVIDPATRKVVHRLDLGAPSGPTGEPPPVGLDQSRLLIGGDRALVLTPQATGFGRLPAEMATPVPPSRRTRITLVDLSGTPRIIGSMSTPSEYVDARQVGSTAHVVVKSTPRIDLPRMPQGPGAEKQALERNRQAVRSAPLDAWLPTFQIEGAGQRTYTTPCANVSRPRSSPGTTMLSVLTLDLTKDLGDPAPVTVAADGQTVYGNGKSLYVTSDPVPEGSERPPQSTHVHRFAVAAGSRPRYVASGTVPGRLLNQYSLSEHDGRLRVATTSVTPGGTPDVTPGGTAGRRSQSAVHVLAQDGGRLQPVGKVDGLGKGERIYSVRFIGTTAYVVTFRQVDPLYVVDLRDPARPRVTGELKITGYSAYLHPTADGRLIGVGQEASRDGRTRGTQVSLFDVSAAPRRVGSFHLPGSSATAEFEPHAFLYWPRTGLTVLPVTHRTAESEALVLKVDGTGVHRLGSVEHPAEGGYAGPILRSLIVGDTLWTVSGTGARATDASTLDERGWLPF